MKCLFKEMQSIHYILQRTRIQQKAYCYIFKEYEKKRALVVMSSIKNTFIVSAIIKDIFLTAVQFNFPDYLLL